MASYYYDCSAVNVNGTTLSNWTETPPITVNGSRCYRLQIGSTDVVHKYYVGTVTRTYTLRVDVYFDFTVSNFSWTYDSCTGDVDGSSAYYSFNVYPVFSITKDTGGVKYIKSSSYSRNGGYFTFNTGSSTNPDSTATLSGSFWDSQNGDGSTIVVTATPGISSSVVVGRSDGGSDTTINLNVSSMSGTLLNVSAGNSTSTKVASGQVATYSNQYSITTTTQIY